jgi:hypothetical protein
MDTKVLVWRFDRNYNGNNSPQFPKITGVLLFSFNIFANLCTYNKIVLWLYTTTTRVWLEHLYWYHEEVANENNFLS